MNLRYSIQGSTSTVGTVTSIEKTTLNQSNDKETTEVFSKTLFFATQFFCALCLVCLFAYLIFRFIKCYKKQKSVQKEAANVSRATNCNMVKN